MAQSTRVPYLRLLVHCTDERLWVAFTYEAWFLAYIIGGGYSLSESVTGERTKVAFGFGAKRKIAEDFLDEPPPKRR